MKDQLEWELKLLNTDYTDIFVLPLRMGRRSKCKNPADMGMPRDFL